MTFRWKFLLGLFLFGSALRLMADNTSSQAAYVLVADGVVAHDAIPPTAGGPDNLGTPQWFVFKAIANHSYIVEVIVLGEFGVANPPEVKPTFYSTLNGNSVSILPPGTVTDVSYSDSAGGFVYSSPPISRFAITPAATTLIDFKVESALGFQTSSSQNFGVRLFDTTLVSARWTANGYNAFVALHNSSETVCPVVVTYYDEDGAILGGNSATLSGHGSVQFVRMASDPTFGGKKGAVEVACKCPPANVSGQVYSVNVSNGSLLQFPLVENRSYGRGSY